MSRRERRLKAVSRLKQIEVFTQDPCVARWDQMEGEGRVRRCLHCNLNVYDFTSMKPEEILDVIKQHEGRLCAQFYVRADGTMTIDHCKTQRETVYAQSSMRGRIALRNPIVADAEFNLDEVEGDRYTILNSATAEGRYVVQTRCPSDVGIIQLAIEPYAGSTHFILQWLVTDKEIPLEFMPAVVEGIQAAAREGLDGKKPIINVRIQVIDGRYHPIDSRANSYKIATKIAFQKALAQSGIRKI